MDDHIDDSAPGAENLIYQAGRDAFFSETGNPYDSKQPEFELWLEGWWSACNDTEEGAASESLSDAT